MDRSNLLGIALMLFLISSCNEKSSISSNIDSDNFKLLEAIPSSHSGIKFMNVIEENNRLNYFTFNYLYIGGAVGVGDVNNDGLQDIYFVGSMVPNRLYLNRGNLEFIDVTEQAGVSLSDGIKTGVSMADVNNDGKVDIYVCRTGAEPSLRSNVLFINESTEDKIKFVDRTSDYGLLDQSPSNHANFFDADLDGDLDLYLLNHPTDFNTVNNLRLQQSEDGSIKRMTTPTDQYESDRFYLNRGNGKFVNVSSRAGIFNRAFGLSVTTSDFNHDGFPDLYIANDYVEPDQVLINNKKGGFEDQFDKYFNHTALSSMGVDISDINNDGQEDVFVLDMLAEDHYRQKLLMTPMKQDRYNTLVQYGYKKQVARNMLQVRTGSNFSEIGCLAGVSNTDWSWGPLIIDINNDGYKDLFIANGFRKDISDLDYVNFTMDSILRTGGVGQFKDINQYLDLIPSTKIRNYVFKNNGDLTFENVTDDWGITNATFSNGTAYADLDNDGDLDLIVNNMEEPASIHKNLTTEYFSKNYIQVEIGKDSEPHAWDCSVYIFADGGKQFQVIRSIRGFLSTSQRIAHFGLGNTEKVDSLIIKWPDGKGQLFTDLIANQKITVKYQDNIGSLDLQLNDNSKIKILKKSNLSPDYVHQENEFNDFDRERLLPHKLSDLGPAMAVGDVNDDGLSDFFIGGASGQASAIYIQNENNVFNMSASIEWVKDQEYEDVDAQFFDFDGDGDLDLFVASGGTSHKSGSELYKDRLYINDGSGNFTKMGNGVQGLKESSSCVAINDIDFDGDLDVIVGGRAIPGKYPLSPKSQILINDGGVLYNRTSKFSSNFENIGMVTDLEWGDVNGDGLDELIVVGEWININVYELNDSKLKNITLESGLSDTEGWWNTIEIVDVDNDGDNDIIAGNLGLNTRLKATKSHPVRIYAYDFDSNGSLDPLLTYYNDGIEYPLAQKDILLQQLPGLKKKFIRYKDYAKAGITDLYSSSILNKAHKKEAKTFASALLLNNDGTFLVCPFPNELQLSPIYDIAILDINHDGQIEFLVGGNTNSMEVETGPVDASSGNLFQINVIDLIPEFKIFENDLFPGGKNLRNIRIVDGEIILIGNNGDYLESYEIQPN